MNPIELNIKTTKQQLVLIADAIKQRISFLESQSNEIEKEIADLTVLLSQISGKQQVEQTQTTILPTEVPLSYNENWPYSKKAEYVLQKFGERLTTSEIANHIKRLQPNLERSIIVNNLSVIFSNQRDRFLRDVNDNNENVYSLAN